jgi:hypothetical protein
MDYAIEFKAYGHPNIKSTHRTTLMITRDPYLTTRGDCIVGIKAEKGLADLYKMVSAAKNEEARIILTLRVQDKQFKVIGRGHPELTYKDPDDIVTRISSFTDDRTLMINADKASLDIPRDIVNLLKEENTPITVRISIKP